MKRDSMVVVAGKGRHWSDRARAEAKRRGTSPKRRKRARRPCCWDSKDGWERGKWTGDELRGRVELK